VVSTAATRYIAKVQGAVINASHLTASGDTMRQWMPQESLSGEKFRPGLIPIYGASEIGSVLGATLMCLCHIAPLSLPLRSPPLPPPSRGSVTSILSRIVRRCWSPYQITPRVHCSRMERLLPPTLLPKPDRPLSPPAFYGWLVSALRAEGRGRVRGKTLVSERDNPAPAAFRPDKIFSGVLSITSMRITDSGGYEEDTKLATDTSGPKSATRQAQYAVLQVRIPEKPLFVDAHRRTVIPEVELSELLAVYDGKTISEDLQGNHRRMTINRLPKCLVIAPVRRTGTGERRAHGIEGEVQVNTVANNPTKLRYPSSLDLSPYLHPQSKDNTPDLPSYSLQAMVCRENSGNESGRDWSAYVATYDGWRKYLSGGVVETAPSMSQILDSDPVLQFWMPRSADPANVKTEAKLEAKKEEPRR
ncbi:hypothetical protein KIPB_011087, partial [Kipferlia bialata]